eukprot:COSAG02_NODE_57868_length_279_cov_0.577778_1_plen_22_part_10
MFLFYVAGRDIVRELRCAYSRF